MKVLEFGNINNKKLVLIHGFQCPYQVWNEYIEYYKNIFHIIVIILENHYPNELDFISYKETSKKFVDYYLSKYNDNIYAIFGMSLGGVIACNIWENKNINIDNLILDGSPLLPYPKILKKYFLNFYLNVSHKTQNRDDKTIKSAINNIIPKKYLKEFLNVLDNMTDENIIRYLNEWGKYKLPNNIESNTNIYYFHGTKINEMIAKKSAKYLEKHYKNILVKKFNKKGHCEISLMNEKVMIKELDNILNTK